LRSGGRSHKQSDGDADETAPEPHKFPLFPAFGQTNWATMPSPTEPVNIDLLDIP